MREISPALQAHLDSGATTLCTCWRVTRTDGIVLGFTDHDRMLNFDGTDFDAGNGGTISALEASAGLAVDNAGVEGVLDADAISAADLDAGRYDGARVEIWRVNWAAPDQRLLLKTGRLGEVTRGGQGYNAELRGLSHRLGEVTGRVWQHGCDAVLGDARCGIDLTAAAYRGTATIVSAGEAELTVAGLEGFADGWFTHGQATFSSGENADLSLAIRRHVANPTVRLSLWQPPRRPVAPGDTLTVTAGCDKAFATCRTKFSNRLNFRGAPHIPGNDFLTAYPVSGDNNDGGKR